MREETILQKIYAGDPAGLEALMERYIPYVSAVVWNILRGAMPAEDGEEVVSDVFLAAWSQPEALRPEERRLVRQAVEALPGQDREIFLRHYYYAQTVQEIAGRMALNESTVKTRLRRGRMKLKELLTREGLLREA